MKDEKLNSYIDNFKFDDTEIQLNRKYDKILKKIKKFDNLINQFEYKRLAFELIEEWEDTKVQIIDELSIIKSFITEICEEKKRDFELNLQEEIKLLGDRISVIQAEFDYLKENHLEMNVSDEENETFVYITQLRKKLFKLDGEIRELLVNNVEFDEIFKDLLTVWVTVKVEIQEYLSELDRQFKTIKDDLLDYMMQIQQSGETFDNQEINGISNELRFQLLQGHIQSIISERIGGVKKLNDNFANLNSKLD
ncbi:MAG: hypothetical protein ACXAAI_14540, partial [Promethearchaeota archaeon]